MVFNNATIGAIPFYIHTPPMDELFCGVPLSRDFLRGPALFRDSEGSHSRDFLRLLVKENVFH